MTASRARRPWRRSPPPSGPTAASRSGCPACPSRRTWPPSRPTSCWRAPLCPMASAASRPARSATLGALTERTTFHAEPWDPTTEVPMGRPFACPAE
ncbi:MAG: hypothetical protein R3F43_17760 [bacterium]